MKNDFYTYAYLRGDGTPYYIGKGRGERAFVKKGRKTSLPPKDRILFLKRNLTEEEAFRHEIYMIAVFGRKENNTGILWNFTDGGEGATGKKVSEETKQKTSASLTGKPSPMRGRENPAARYERTPEWRENLRKRMEKAVIGVNTSGETRVFDSALKAHLITGVNHGNINQCCRGKRKTAGGWKWSYLD